MKLQKWKCNVCEYEWYENIGKSGMRQSGCPKGCLDIVRPTEEVICIAESKGKRSSKKIDLKNPESIGSEWECWTLNKREIEYFIKHLGYERERFTLDIIEDIASWFRSYFISANSEWEITLEYVVKKVADQYGIKKQSNMNLISVTT